MRRPARSSETGPPSRRYSASVAVLGLTIAGSGVLMTSLAPGPWRRGSCCSSYLKAVPMEIKMIASNRRATHEYSIGEVFEAGLEGLFLGAELHFRVAAYGLDQQEGPALRAATAQGR